MVDVEQGPLAALEQHDLAVVERVVQKQRGVRDVRAKGIGVRQEVLGDRVDLERASVVDLDQHLVLALQRAFDLLAQDRRVEQVLHPDAEAGDLVAVRRSDAAAGRADLGLAEEALGHLVEGHVVRRDEVRVRTDDELGGVDTTLVQRGHLVEQHSGVDDHAVADDGHDRRREDAAGQQVERELLVTDDHGVSGVVSALVPNDVVDATAEEVGGLSLAFVAPLGIRRERSLARETRLAGIRALHTRRMAAKDIDDYLAGLDETKRATLQRLRETINSLAPDAVETISYGMPAFKEDGKVVAGFAAFAKHLAYLPHSGTTLASIEDAIAGYEHTKSSLHFAIDKPLPKTLVKKLIAARRKEIRA